MYCVCSMSLLGCYKLNDSLCDEVSVKLSSITALNKGHNTFNLSIKDKFCGPYRNMAMQFYGTAFI